MPHGELTSGKYSFESRAVPKVVPSTFCRQCSSTQARRSHGSSGPSGLPTIKTRRYIAPLSVAALPVATQPDAAIAYTSAVAVAAHLPAHLPCSTPTQTSRVQAPSCRRIDVPGMFICLLAVTISLVVFHVCGGCGEWEAIRSRTGYQQQMNNE